MPIRERIQAETALSPASRAVGRNGAGGRSVLIPVMAIPCLFAKAITFSLSSSSSRPAWNASVATPARFITLRVLSPTTGMSKRMSWPSRAPLTSTAPLPPSRPPRLMAAFVPSNASTARTMPSFTRTVCPTSCRPMSRTTAEPCSMSRSSRPSGARAVMTPSPGRWPSMNDDAGKTGTPAFSNSSASLP